VRVCLYTRTGAEAGGCAGRRAAIIGYHGELTATAPRPLPALPPFFVRLTARWAGRAYCVMPGRALRGYPGVVLFNSARVLFNSARVPTRVYGPYRSKNIALGVFRTPGGGAGDLFCPLVHVDWGIFGQLATRANGHLGLLRVFIATQCS
jgi:hypothetical protein